MKKLLTLVFAMILVSSCEDTASIEISTSTSINETVTVAVLQTTGNAVTYDETVTQDLNQLVSNFNDISNINIDALRYKFKNVTGNVNAVIESAIIVINGNTITTITNVNIAQEATNATIFPITDTAVLDQLETLFLNNNSLSIQFSGMVISDAGDVNFEIDVSIDLTATL
jgi:uncharacterized membrane protein